MLVYFLHYVNKCTNLSTFYFHGLPSWHMVALSPGPQDCSTLGTLLLQMKLGCRKFIRVVFCGAHTSRNVGGKFEDFDKCNVYMGHNESNLESLPKRACFAKKETILCQKQGVQCSR